MFYVVYNQRDKFLRELVRPVIVTAVCQHDRQPEGIVESPYKMVGRSLGSGIRRMWLVAVALLEKPLVELQGTIHLICRNMVETVLFLHLLCISQIAAPVFLGRLEQSQRSNDVGLGKSKRILDAPVHVALRRKMNDTVHLILLQSLRNFLKITDIALHKHIVLAILYVFKVGQIASVSQLVIVDNLCPRILLHEQPDGVGTNKPRSPCNHYCFHILPLIFILQRKYLAIVVTFVVTYV